MTKKKKKSKNNSNDSSDNDIPESIKERNARLAKRKAEEKKKREARQKKIPDGAVKDIRSSSKSRSKTTTGDERNKYNWFEVLSNEIIRLSGENRAIRRRIEKLEKDDK